MIRNLTVNKEQGTIKWYFGEHLFNYVIDNIDQVIVDENNKLIIILSGPHSYPDKLTVVDEGGGELFSCDPPVGACFSYLTKEPLHNILINCVFDDKLDGWYDWNYSLDLTDKTLIRVSPSY